MATLIANTFQLLNEKGFLYVSFVAGDPAKSGYKTASTGDRTYFYYHKTESLVEQLTESGCPVIRSFTIEYKTGGGESEPNTIIIAQKTGPVS